MTTAYAPQTTTATMERIAAGVDPWIAHFFCFLLAVWGD